MATVIIRNKSKAAKLMLEYLKTQRYATVIEEDNEPNEVTLRAIEEVKTGQTTKYKNADELIEKLRKDVQNMK